MKQNIHPDNYRPVIFKDVASGERFLISSTIETEQTDTWDDGKEYPFVEIEVSSASHPFYTGQEKVLDTTGRVERFKARREQAEAAQAKRKESQQPKKDQPSQQTRSTSREGSISIDADKTSDN